MIRATSHSEEPHARARGEFNERVMPSLDLIDIFRELHPAARKYTWFRPGARRLDAARVDFALIGRGLRDRIVDADIVDDVDARFGSDHAPITLALRIASPSRSASQR